MKKFDVKRAIILSVIRNHEPISVTNLAKEVNLSKGTTIYRYLRELKQRGLITLEKQKKKVGQPTMVSTTAQATPMIEPVAKVLETIANAFSGFGKKKKSTS